MEIDLAWISLSVAWATVKVGGSVWPSISIRTSPICTPLASRLPEASKKKTPSMLRSRRKLAGWLPSSLSLINEVRTSSSMTGIGLVATGAGISMGGGPAGGGAAKTMEGSTAAAAAAAAAETA